MPLDREKAQESLIYVMTCAPLEFAKSSPGGIMGHRYFDLRQFFPGKIPTELPEIAARLRGQSWE